MIVGLIFAAALDLWPGFVPEKIPMVISDGVTANTSVDIDGVETATVMRNDPALIAHEKFHVYQRTRHPKWSANEVDLFTYPVADADAIVLHRLELEALRRALASKAGRCWTRTALDLRRQRFAKIGATAAAYERGTELNEGLATYVEHRVSAKPAELRDGLPEAVRERAYQTGHALALLLDRYDPRWRESLERDDTRTLDELLDGATRNAKPCTFSPEERATVTVRAISDARGVATRRAQRRDAFLAQPGWTLTITSDAPLFPERFDPLNVHAVGEGEVLHTRHLKLNGQAGTLEILDRHALTDALFTGVRRVVLTGIATEPHVHERDGITTIDLAGITAQLRGARIAITRQ